MRTLSAAAAAAVDAVITAPGHLIELRLTPTPARWSDIGQVVLSDGRVYAAVDMKISGIAAQGDSAPEQFSISFGNLDSSIGALLLANDLTAVPLVVYAFDRAAIALADFVPLGTFTITQAQIGIERATLTCAPIRYTAPFRRVDVPNGFKFAAPAGTKISWGAERLILDRLNPDYYYYG